MYWGFCSKAHGMRVKLRLVAKLWFAPGVDEGGVQKEMKHWIKSNTFHALLPTRRHSDCHLSTRSFSSCWWSNYTTRLLELMICSASAFSHSETKNQDYGMFERIDEKLGGKRKTCIFHINSVYL